MAPQLLLRLALAMLEVASFRGLRKGDTTLLVRVMDLIKREIDIDDPHFEAALIEDLKSPESADILQLWHLASLAAKHPQGAGPVPQKSVGE